MAQMMKAAVVQEFGKPLKIEEVPIPTPRRGEVLIKLVANAFAIRTSMRPRVTGRRSRRHPLA
jgi:Zn-dependent alcohol dehydrogenase